MLSINVREDSITKQTKKKKCTWCVTCLIYFPRVARCKGRYGRFVIEVVRGFLYPKYIVRTSSGCVRIGTCSFRLWCDEREKNENLKVRNMYVCGMSIYFPKGRQETSR